MKHFEALPEGYREIYSVNLQKNKKVALIVNALAVVIALAMAIPMHFRIPFGTMFSTEDGAKAKLIKYGIFIALTVAYLVLHELVHGIAMKLCGTKKVKYGFTGIYAFAGSKDFYDKSSYIFIALAPVVFWGVVLAVINPFVPLAWFWVVYFLQIFNLSGAAGDLFVTVKFSRLPKDILVQDHGVGMMVYSKKQ